MRRSDVAAGRNRGRAGEIAWGVAGAARHWAGIYAEKMGLESLAEKRWHAFAMVLLILYMEFVAYGQHTCYGGNSPLLDALAAVIVVPLCVGGVLLARRMRMSPVPGGRRNSRARGALLCLAVFLATLAYCFAWQRAYWPGSFLNDNIIQYGWAKDGTYNDWHPALHTWLFYTFPLRLHLGPAAIVLLQLVYFSLAVAYLFFVLYQCGARTGFLILSLAYILLNPNTTNMMLYPAKDSAFAIFSLVVFTHVIRIFESGGKWLGRWRNLAAFSAFCFLAMHMRHNGILLVAPLLGVLLAFFKGARGRIAVALGIVALGTLVLKGPVYDHFDVQPASGRTLETTGMAMGVLLNIYYNDAGSMPPDAAEFMKSINADQMRESYVAGEFNSVKWIGINRGAVDEEGFTSIMRYLFQSWAGSPRYAWEGFANLTRMVWSVDCGSGWGIDAAMSYIAGDEGVGYHDRSQWLLREAAAYTARARQGISKYLFQYLGLVIAALLFLAVASIGGGGLGRAFTALSLMAYNFGTMLLLSGPDFRFFFLNFLLVVPLLFLLTAREFGGDSREPGSKRNAE